MRYHALACDYDGTLARDGQVSEQTLAALDKLSATGRKLILVTGRELSELLATFPEIEMFHQVVAENGALLYTPSTRQEKILAQAPPELFIRKLQERHIEPLSIGRVIVSTRQPHEMVVLETIRDLGLDLQVIFNKGAVMVLPASINKSTGLAAAIDSLGLSMHGVVGIGDAENDYAFLDICEYSVAVANAVDGLKEHVDWVTGCENEAGVGELIEELIANDLESHESDWTRHHLLFGTRTDGSDIWLSPRGPNILVIGPSGSGKSSAASAFIERLREQQYQFCIVDPEGDYEGTEDAVTLGRSGRGPIVDEVLEILTKPQHNAVVNLIGLPVAERPPFFLEVLPQLQDLRARTGRPQWIIVDEAHHLIPASWEPAALTSLRQLERTLFITVHPDQLFLSALESIGTLIVVGNTPAESLAQFCKPLGLAMPSLDKVSLDDDSVLLWPVSQGQDIYAVKVASCHAERQRHARKYATGELPPDRSFFFRGPDGKLNLRAQNLQMFLQLAEGVDAETWMYHLQRGDYSRWFQTCIKDEHLATETQGVEQQVGISADESRGHIREIVDRCYAVPSSPPLPIPGTDAASIREPPE